LLDTARRPSQPLRQIRGGLLCVSLTLQTYDFPIAERLHIADDLIALRQAYDATTDYGIREVIRAWILDAERVLEEGVEKSA
jgi:hypothetical protein